MATDQDESPHTLRAEGPVEGVMRWTPRADVFRTITPSEHQIILQILAILLRLLNIAMRRKSPESRTEAMAAILQALGSAENSMVPRKGSTH